jgi:lipopolysaccharide transport system ATP-binding protein
MSSTIHDPQSSIQSRPSDCEVLVRVENVSKIFCRDLKKSLLYGLQDSAKDLFSFGKPGRDRPPGGPTSPSPAGGSSSSSSFSKSTIQNQQSSIVNQSSNSRPLRPGEFHAVNNVSFELRRGECLGLIGHNGAGKTTLLKMLNGLIKPDAGRIEMRGRVGALIALGAGFNPILTGRENIYVNASVLGLSKSEINTKIDEIINFAEIREFIDAPVQSYSSGMQVRLGFAVATALQPDVLLLDEVLAVGDSAFRNKCYQRIDELRDRAAIIFVSHNMPDVGRICQKSIVMAQGRAAFQGETLEGIQHYNQLNESTNTADNPHHDIHHPIREFSVEIPDEVAFNAPLDFSLRVVADEDAGPVDLTVALSNASGGYAAVGICNSQRFGFEVRKGLNEWRCRLANIPLRNGHYPMTVHLIDRTGKYVAFEANVRKLRVSGAYDGIPGECQLEIKDWK